MLFSRSAISPSVEFSTTQVILLFSQKIQYFCPVEPKIIKGLLVHLKSAVSCPVGNVLFNWSNGFGRLVIILAPFCTFCVCACWPSSGVCAGGGGVDEDDEALEGDWLVGSWGWSSSSLGEGQGEGLPRGDSWTQWSLKVSISTVSLSSISHITVDVNGFIISTVNSAPGISSVTILNVALVLSTLVLLALVLLASALVVLACSNLALFSLDLWHGGHVCQTAQLIHLVHRHGNAGRGQAHREKGVGHDHKRKIRQTWGGGVKDTEG